MPFDPPGQPVPSQLLSPPADHAAARSAGSTASTASTPAPALPSQLLSPPPLPSRPAADPSGELLHALVFPGLGMMNRTMLLGVVTTAIGVVLPMFVLGWAASQRGDLVALASDNLFWVVAFVGGVAAILARVVAIGEVAVVRRHHRSTGPATIMACVALLALAIPIGYGVHRVDQARPSRPATGVPGVPDHLQYTSDTY